MTYEQILRIADAGYKAAANDGGILHLIDAETGKPDTKGDSLARAIVIELDEGVDYSGSPGEVVTSALDVMFDMRDQIEGVIEALLKAEAETGHRP